MKISFDSYRDYFSFIFAKDFYDLKQKQMMDCSVHPLEKVGGAILSPLFKPLDQILQNIKNPLVITALTTTALAIATLIFYPVHFMDILTKAIPLIGRIQPWMVKLALFCVVELNILALGLRTLGRLSNATLVQAWNRRDVEPIAIGAQII